MKKFLSFFILTSTVFTLLIMSSCGAGIVTNINNCNDDELATRADAFLSAASVYAQDPSVENCKAYKKSLEDYIDIIDDCSFSSINGKKEAEQVIAELDC